MKIQADYYRPSHAALIVSQIVQELVNAGAAAAAVDAEGYTPAQQAFASDHSEVGTWLLQCSSNTSSSSTCSGSAGATKHSSLRSSPHSSSSRSMSPFCQQLQQQCNTGNSSSNSYTQQHSDYSSSTQRGRTLNMADCDDMQEDCLDATVAAA
eukprot:8560-Heterococcus_DN1.PRE.1